MENLATQLGGEVSPPNSTANSWISAGGDVLSSVLNMAGQYFLNKQQFNNQKQLFDYQAAYNNPSREAERLREAGLTPAAIAQHLAGVTSSQSMPQSSFSPAPSLHQSLGDSFINAKRATSEILERNAMAAEHNKSIQLMEQQRFWNDRLYFQQVQESISRTLHNYSLIPMNQNQSRLFYEEAESIKLKRPWELDTLKAGLLKIQQDISESVSRTYYNYEAAKTEPIKRANLSADTELKYNYSFNEAQKGFMLLFENDLRASGWNPNSNFWQNVGRLAVTKPKQASALIDNLNIFVGDLDNRCKSVFGEHYKRNAILGVGLYKAHQAVNNGIDKTLGRLNTLTGTIGNIVPLTHPQPVHVKGYSRY